MQNIKNLNLKITNIPIFLSLITSIVYCTWYFATIDRRIALAEQREVEIQSQITNYQQEIRSQISQLNNGVEQIYQILLDAKQKNRSD